MRSYEVNVCVELNFIGFELLCFNQYDEVVYSQKVKSAEVANDLGQKYLNGAYWFPKVQEYEEGH